MVDVTPIGRSAAQVGAWTDCTAPAIAGAAAGDWQVASWSSHSSIAAPTLTGAGWERISNTTTAHSRLAIYRRQLTAATTGQAVTAPFVGAHQHLALRVYRGATGVAVAGTGAGLVHPARAVTGLLLRITVDTEDNAASFPVDKRLVPAAALTHQTDEAFRNYQWYNGQVSGNDPTPNGGTAPARTTVETVLSSGAPIAGGRFPQWADVMLVLPPPAPNPPTALTVLELAARAATVSWTAPAAGAAPTGYELRVNGGAVTAVAGTSRELAGLTPGTSYIVEVRTVAASGSSAWAAVLFTTPELPPPSKPWLVSQQLLARAEADPEGDQPAFLWLNYAGGWAVDELRSRALMGWTITTGRQGPRDRVPPAVVTVTLAAWDEYAAAGLPELGARFRLALSPLLAGAGIAAGDLPRFTGEVTDVDLDPATGVLTVTGVGRYARQGRQGIDGTGWPLEREGARVARVLDAIGATAGTLDPGRVELAPPAAAGSAAQHLDAVSDSTTGQLVERRDGALDWHDADHRRDAPIVLELDAGELLRGFRWAQRVGDLTNAATVRYVGGEVHVEDTASVTARGEYPASLDTLLTRAAAAQAIGGLIVGRYGRPVWLLPAVMVDLIRTLPAAELGAGVALTHGHRVQLSGLPAGGPYTERAAFVEGVTETLTPRSWRLTVTVSDERLSGSPLRWRDVPDGTRWTDVRDGLRWLDVATIQDPAELL